MLLELCSLLTLAGLSCQASLLVWTSVTVFFALVIDTGSGIFKAGFAGARRGAANLLLEPQGPQRRVQWHAVVHTVDVSPLVQILGVPVPQGPTGEIPGYRRAKVSQYRIPQRLADGRRPQKAEQLEDVPTEPAYVEQIVDISVPGGGGRRL